MKILRNLFRALIGVLMLITLPGPAFLSAVFPISAHAKEAQFFDNLGKAESGGNYTKVNKFGYLGKYQFGEQALVSLGYYISDGSKANDWKGKWSGKGGVFSKEDFLKNGFVQEVAVRELVSFHWDVAVVHGMDKTVGKVMHGVKITRNGILAAMHLVGPQGVKNFLSFGTNTEDGFGTTVKQYITKFSKLEA